MRTSGKIAAPIGLHGGDHVCLRFRSDGERRDAYASYFHEGFSRGERLVYLADPTEGAGMVLSWLAAAEVPVTQLLDEGGLHVFDAEAMYMPDGRFDPDAALTGFRAAAATAVAEGYSGARAAGEMTWATRAVVDDPELVSYEFSAGEATVDTSLIGMCSYDARVVDVERLSLVESVHAARCLPAGSGDVPFWVWPSGENVVVEGEVDFASARRFGVVLQQTCLPGSGEVRLELSRLRFIDLTGLRELVEIASALAERSRTLRLLLARETLRRCLDILGIARHGNVTFE